METRQDENLEWDGGGNGGERRDLPDVLPPLTPDGTLAAAFDALTRVQGDFLPGGRQQGMEQEREAL